MKVEDKEILQELRNEQKKNKEILKILVKERIKTTSENKFDISDINKWSAFFNMSMQTFMFEVLMVSQDDLKNLLCKRRNQITSLQFNLEKEKIINYKKKEFCDSLNLNSKNYFNRNELLVQADKLEINANDFALNILGKSGSSFRKVMVDETDKRRLSFGTYNNTSLPKEFIDKNFEEMEKMTGKAINKAVHLLGMKVTSEDYKDIKQDCLEYIFKNGNMLNKSNKPTIKGIKMTDKQKNHIRKQEFYYAINKIKEYYKKFLHYNDACKCRYNIENDDVYTCINQTFKDERTQKIFTYLYNYGACEEVKQKLMRIFNLTENQLEEIINVNAVKLR